MIKTKRGGNMFNDFIKEFDKEIDKDVMVSAQTNFEFDVWDTGQEEKIWRNQPEPGTIWNNLS